MRTSSPKWKGFTINNNNGRSVRVGFTDDGGVEHDPSPPEGMWYIEYEDDARSGTFYVHTFEVAMNRAAQLLSLPFKYHDSGVGHRR